MSSILAYLLAIGRKERWEGSTQQSLISTQRKESNQTSLEVIDMARYTLSDLEEEEEDE